MPSDLNEWIGLALFLGTVGIWVIFALIAGGTHWRRK